MKKPELYRLSQDGCSTGCIAIYRTDNNYGLLGYIFNDGIVRQDYYKSSLPIPKYIIRKCLQLLNTNE